MKKVELFDKVNKSVLEVLNNNKVDKSVQAELLEVLRQHLEPKGSGGNSLHPPMEIDGVMNYYCRWHQKYYPEEFMVMSKGKSKGYCKAAISKWNKTNSEIKKLESEAVKLMSSGNFDKAQEVALASRTLKDNFNKPEFYSQKEDWEVFNKNNKKEVEKDDI